MTGIPALTSLLVLRMNRQQDPQSVSAKDITAVPTQLSAAATGSNGHRSQAAACNVEPGSAGVHHGRPGSRVDQDFWHMTVEAVRARIKV